MSVGAPAASNATTAGAAHFTPVVCAESAVKMVLFAPTPCRATVLSAVATIRSPFTSTIDGLIPVEADENCANVSTVVSNVIGFGVVSPQPSPACAVPDVTSVNI